MELKEGTRRLVSRSALALSKCRAQTLGEATYKSQRSHRRSFSFQEAYRLYYKANAIVVGVLREPGRRFEIQVTEARNLSTTKVTFNNDFSLLSPHISL